MTTRGDWEKYQSGRPNKLIRAVFVSYVSEQRVLRMLPPEETEKTVTHNIIELSLSGLLKNFYSIYMKWSNTVYS